MAVVRGLVRATHPEPTVAVTAVSAALAAAVGRGVAGTLAATAAVLAGQLSVGWMNDYLDRDRDVRSGRADKPVATGRLGPATVRTAMLAAAVAVVPLSLLSGPVAGCLHLAAVASAWSYNLRLKATPFSVVPYAVSFGLLPAFLTAGLPGHPVVGWLVAAGALLGAGAHFANVLPDIEDDLATGVRGLPHRLGPPGSRLAAAGLLLAASVVLALGPPGPPGLLGVGAVAVALACAAGIAVLGRRPGSRATFLGVLVVAVVDVGLLLASGTAVR
ncbi:MAG TPA: UbiA family prenyltransferase [Mycobacteriales bacterium]